MVSLPPDVLYDSFSNSEPVGPGISLRILTSLTRGVDVNILKEAIIEATIVLLRKTSSKTSDRSLRKCNAIISSLCCALVYLHDFLILDNILFLDSQRIVNFLFSQSYLSSHCNSLTLIVGWLLKTEACKIIIKVISMIIMEHCNMENDDGENIRRRILIVTLSIHNALSDSAPNHNLCHFVELIDSLIKTADSSRENYNSCSKLSVLSMDSAILIIYKYMSMCTGSEQLVVAFNHNEAVICLVSILSALIKWYSPRYPLLSSVIFSITSLVNCVDSVDLKQKLLSCSLTATVSVLPLLYTRNVLCFIHSDIMASMISKLDVLANQLKEISLSGEPTCCSSIVLSMLVIFGILDPQNSDDRLFNAIRVLIQFQSVSNNLSCICAPSLIEIIHRVWGIAMLRPHKHSIFLRYIFNSFFAISEEFINIPVMCVNLYSQLFWIMSFESIHDLIVYMSIYSKSVLRHLFLRALRFRYHSNLNRQCELVSLIGSYMLKSEDATFWSDLFVETSYHLSLLWLSNHHIISTDHHKLTFHRTLARILFSSVESNNFGPIRLLLDSLTYFPYRRRVFSSVIASSPEDLWQFHCDMKAAESSYEATFEALSGSVQGIVVHRSETAEKILEFIPEFISLFPRIDDSSSELFLQTILMEILFKMFANPSDAVLVKIFNKFCSNRKLSAGIYENLLNLINRRLLLFQHNFDLHHHNNSFVLFSHMSPLLAIKTLHINSEMSDVNRAVFNSLLSTMSNLKEFIQVRRLVTEILAKFPLELVMNSISNMLDSCLKSTNIDIILLQLGVVTFTHSVLYNHGNTYRWRFSMASIVLSLMEFDVGESESSVAMEVSTLRRLCQDCLGMLFIDDIKLYQEFGVDSPLNHHLPKDSPGSLILHSCSYFSSDKFRYCSCVDESLTPVSCDVSTNFRLKMADSIVAAIKILGSCEICLKFFEFITDDIIYSIRDNLNNGDDEWLLVTSVCFNILFMCAFTLSSLSFSGDLVTRLWSASLVGIGSDNEAICFSALKLLGVVFASLDNVLTDSTDFIYTHLPSLLSKTLTLLDAIDTNDSFGIDIHKLCGSIRQGFRNAPFGRREAT